MNHLFWIVTFHYWKMNVNFQFYDLDKTYEPTLTLEPKLDLSFIPKSVLASIPFIVEPKSSIPQNHILLLDQDLNQYDSVMTSQDWSYNRKKFHARIMHDPTHIREYKNANKKEVIKGEFHENSQYLCWAETVSYTHLTLPTIYSV